MERTCITKLSVVSFMLLSCAFFMACSKENDGEGIGSGTAPELSLNKEELVLEIGASERLVASFNPPETPNKAHSWTSSAANIASVDETGMVTAVSTGTAVITAQALDGGKKALCNVQVVAEVIHVTGLSLNITRKDIAVGEQVQLVATVNPENATDKTVVWTSTDDGVATVDGTGRVTGIAAGTATITATSNDGNKKAACQLTVSERGATIFAPEVSDVTSNTAHVSGNITAVGAELQEVGLCYGSSPSPTVNDHRVKLSGENVSYTLNGLSPATTYYVRFYAVVEGETVYGDQKEFTTLPVVVTEFSPTDIYESKILLTSPAPAGITNVDICFGTTPNPTVTSGNVTKVTVEEDGQLHLTLEGLKSATTYYLRSYSRTGTNITYNDDEVAVQTFGGDIQIKKQTIKREKYKNPLSGLERYRVYLKIDYKIKGSGTYLIEIFNEDWEEVDKIYTSLGRGDNYSNELYIDGGEGTFNCKIGEGNIEYSGRNSYIAFPNFTLRFTDLNTSIRYHSSKLADNIWL